MRLAACIGRSAWLGYWRLMRNYHRYEVHGVEHLERVGPALIVGYHGRPGARDLCMLQSYLLERNGSATHAVAHRISWNIPGLQAAAEGMSFLPGNGEEMAAAVRRGEKIIITPGGTAEGCRSHKERYRVRWGERLGYLRLALEYRLPIIPTAATGTDDAFIGLIDGYSLARRLKMPKVPLWLGVGPLGPWPLTPPFPVKITQYVGAPIRLDDDKRAARNPTFLKAWHEKIARTVQDLLDQGNVTTGKQKARLNTGRQWVDQSR